HYDRRFMRVLAAFTSLRTKERDEHKPRHIKRRQHRHDERDWKQKKRRTRKGRRQNGVLRIKSAQRGHTHQREGPDQKSPKSNWQLRAQPAHVPNILLMMHRMNYAAGAKEQQGFKKRMRAQVKHRRIRSRKPNR